MDNGLQSNSPLANKKKPIIYNVLKHLHQLFHLTVDDTDDNKSPVGSATDIEIKLSPIYLLNVLTSDIYHLHQIF